MSSRIYRKTNHLAVLGFLLPFAAAGVTAGLVLWAEDKSDWLLFVLPYLTLVPAMLVIGLILAFKSIPLIRERDDKDYAYSGLTLNIIFLGMYSLSVIYLFI